MNNEEKLKRIQLEQQKIEKQISDHAETLPDLMDQILKQKTKLETALNDIGSAMGDPDDLEWLADDIIDFASELAASVRLLSKCK